MRLKISLLGWSWRLSYVPKVVEHVYDYIDQLISLDNEDLTSFLEFSGPQAKPGHKQRFWLTYVFWHPKEHTESLKRTNQSKTLQA